ncbi:hypothetical protein ACIQ62_15195 [Streptomyces sp. NPDC096319]|uniref:hypothetical protein n=1 Tax=Streptomyces sp. NPDC096319 TaxID=3366084 RepID=UPI0038259349
MTTESTSRRSLLAAALAVPAAAAGGTLLGAAPAAAVGPSDGLPTGIEIVVPWTGFTSLGRPGLEALNGNAPQARVVRIAGTDFLQMRGGVRCAKDNEFEGGSAAEDLDLVGVLPAELRPATTYVRGVAPRNSSGGFSTCRIEVTTAGRVYVYGATSGNKISWIQLDSLSAIWR